MSSTYVDFYRRNVLHIQNTGLLCVSMLSTISCVSFYYNKHLFFPSNFISSIILGYSVLDLLNNKPTDLKIHHYSVIGIMFYKFYYRVSDSDIETFLCSFYKVEISSIFYVLKYYVNKKSYLYHINLLLFYLLFLKFRVCDFYYNIISYESSLYTIIYDYSSNNILLSGILLSSCYTLYMLNLYWFFLMNKLLYKQITNNSK